MKIKVKYFASIREWTGVKEEEVDLPEGSTAEELKRSVQRLHSNIDNQEGTILVAVNGGFVEPSRLLSSGDEVALFPPVSGG
jgi:molybdopterin converting factor subunit 1